MVGDLTWRPWHLSSTRGARDAEASTYDDDDNLLPGTPRVEIESELDGIDIDGDFGIDDEDESEEDFLRRELAHLESLEDMLAEFDDGSVDDDDGTDDDSFLFEDDNDDDSDPVSFLTELLESIDDDEDEDSPADEVSPAITPPSSPSPRQSSSNNLRTTMSALESALLQGVVPVGAGVGDDSLPGDFGFDPLKLSERDLILPVQSALLRILPGGGGNTDTARSGEDGTKEIDDPSSQKGPRPRALILRDYREAEIRHSRLAMLAAVIWPLQEMLDRLLLDEDLYGPLLYGPVTLPYFPLLMTAILLLLGYLDIYSMAIKEMDDIGDAYLPGDCFWDPLRILAGTNPSTKRRMQERELFNGRAAMLAVAAFAWEELVTGQPVIEIEGNALLFQPLYQVPFVQAWLDAQFSR